MSYDVFVSYSSKDKIVADTIVASMEKNHIRCWYAPRDIKPGDDWGNAILDAIEKSKVFLIVFSGNANHSKRVLDELNIAISEEITILPFRIENLEPKGAMKLHLSSHHWLDAYDPSWEVHIKKLVKDVSIIINASCDEDNILLPERLQTIKQKQVQGRVIKVLAGAGLSLILATAIWFGSRTFFPMIRNAEPTATSTALTAPPTQTFTITSTQIKKTLTPTWTLTLSPSPSPGIHSTLTREKDNMEMVYVPAGDFIMGLSQDEIDGFIDQEWCNICEQNLFSTTQPAHKVYLDAFWIDKFEVSNAQYAQCVTDGACSQPLLLESHSRTEYYGSPQFDHYPVSSVSWFQAREYCQWAGGRLPTEAEWEKTARGTEGGDYPWGNEIPTSQLANSERSIGDTTRVGSYPDGASPFGAHDMAGNVWEWVSDWWGYYDSNPSTNPMGPPSGDYHVLRGGAWDSDPWSLLTAFRNGRSPEFAGFYVGFRCTQPP